MRFEWNVEKNKTNLEKHGLSFAEASHIFDRVVLTWIDKRKDYKETREISIGMLDKKLVIVVAHTDRNGVTRIISARTANRKERGLYHEHIKTAY